MGLEELLFIYITKLQMLLKVLTANL